MADKAPLRTKIAWPGILPFGLERLKRANIRRFFQDKTIVQVACGINHFAAVSSTGKVYIAHDDFEPKFVATLGQLNITQAACGNQFSMYLTDQGELYACGCNGEGQLGLHHRKTIASPTRVNGLPRVKKVVAGEDFTLVLTLGGEVWVCGNNKGQLGLGHKRERKSFTQIRNLPTPIVDVACGWYHSVLLTESKVILVTGYLHEQLGLGEVRELYSFKPLLGTLPAIAAIACGSEHTVALGDDGTVWAWGYNGRGQLGTGDTSNRDVPTMMIGLENHWITKVFAGNYHTALLTTEGEVFICGDSDNEELGPRKIDILVPTVVPKSQGLVVKQVSFSLTYTLMLVEPKLNIPPTPKEGGRPTLQIDGVSKWKNSIVRSLECPVCFKMMLAPIHLCLNGHNLCGACRNNLTVCPLCRGVFSNIRNIALEGLSMEIELPCDDCLQSIPACELEVHVAVCPKRNYSCPVDQTCAWSGRADTMIAHTSSEHPDQTWQNLGAFLHSTADEILHTDVLMAHDQIFTVHRVFNKATGEFMAVVRYIGPTDDKVKFKTEFSIIADDDERIFRRNLCPDTESVEDSFRSSNCILMERQSVGKFLQQDTLMCRATILKVETT